MGKCLSCCQASESVIKEDCAEKFTDAVHHSGVLQHEPGLNKGDLCHQPCLNENKGSTKDNMVNDSDGKPLKSASEKPGFSMHGSSQQTDKQSSHSREISEHKIHTLFEQYKDPNEDAVLTEGIEKLCQDLDVMLDDFRVLLLAWKFNAKQMFCFTREEFVSGCRNLRVECISDIQSKFPELVAEVEAPENFKYLYRFTFHFGLERDQRVLQSEMAIQLWKLVFSQKEPPILERWLGFLAKNPNVRGISRDTWNMFLNFAESVSDDLSSYDDTAAWPSLFDDFVEYENDQTNQNILSSKEKSVLDA